MKRMLKRLEAKIRRRKIRNTPLDVAMLRLILEVDENTYGKEYRVSTGYEIGEMTASWEISVSRAPMQMSVTEYLQ